MSRIRMTSLLTMRCNSNELETAQLKTNRISAKSMASVQLLNKLAHWHQLTSCTWSNYWIWVVTRWHDGKNGIQSLAGGACNKEVLHGMAAYLRSRRFTTSTFAAPFILLNTFSFQASHSGSSLCAAFEGATDRHLTFALAFNNELEAKGRIIKQAIAKAT